ncbi:MAG: nitroreductase family protein, partial [Candidatus Omnitrophica bacterium]|nr:nitroreductase family protein [Candidatus Omnitrophota bacterium]
VDRDPVAVYEGFSFQVEDAAASVENMLLAATALGYASVWIEGWLMLEGRAAKIGKVLNVPGNKVIKIMLPIGVPDEKMPQKERKPFEERAWFNSYGAAAA